jgi:hypothetical protein
MNLYFMFSCNHRCYIPSSGLLTNDSCYFYVLTLLYAYLCMPLVGDQTAAIAHDNKLFSVKKQIEWICFLFSFNHGCYTCFNFLFKN